MEEHVCFEITPFTEELSADFTFSRLLACVDEHVLFEILQATESLSTDFTSVRLLA